MLDEFRSTYITWDKATSRIYSPVTANESDENGRKLVVQIVNSGKVEDLTGATLHLYWETRDKVHDGLDVFKAVDLEKGEFELSYTTGMLSNHGVLNANLVLIYTVGRVVSERFKITVTEGIDNDAIQSENSFSSLTQALIDVSNLEQNYAPRLNDLTAQLQQTEQELSSQLADKADKSQVGAPTQEQVSAWLSANPQATTTVQDDSITSAKLTEKHRFRATATGVDLNTLSKEGNYYAISPVNSPNNLSGVVEVANFNDIVIQTFTQHNDPTQVWKRRIFRGAPESWIKEQISEVINISRSRLTADYNAYTVPATLGNGTNLNTIISEGYYFIVAGATNVPTTFNGSFFLEVKRTSVNFAIQIAYELNNPEKVMIRQISTTTPSGLYKWMNTSQSPQADRNWIAMGDSITANAIRYFYRTRDLLQVNGTNAGVGGASMASRPDATYELYEADAFANKTNTLDFTTQNVVTVFFGTNDFGASVPMGAVDSIDKTTFNGAMNVGLANIYASNPAIDIVFITPIWRNGWDVPNTQGLTLKAYVDAIIAFCERNNIACYDAFRKSGINSHNHPTFLSDGLHPNEIGGDKLGSCIASAVKTLI